MSYKVRDLLRCSHADLRVIAGKKGLDREIVAPELNRPSLELTGYFRPIFRYRRIQILGSGELAFIREILESEPDRMRANLERLFSYDLPCVIATGSSEIPALLRELGESHDIPIMVTGNDTTRLYRRVVEFLEIEYAPTTRVHGVFVEVVGIGTLIVGEAGVGKSECALDLVTRGHSLVADDLVEICCLSDAVLVGRAIRDTSGFIISHHMEIRGLGIIDIQRMFGGKAVHLQRSLDLTVQLEPWDENKQYDRTGLKESSYELLGVSVPMLTVPVKPGRDVAMLIEVAAIRENLKRMGYSAAEELDRRQRALLDNWSEPLNRVDNTP
jgi:HPr kinase/phosphorylase